MQQSTPRINHLIDLKTRNQYFPPPNFFLPKWPAKSTSTTPPSANSTAPPSPPPATCPALPSKPWSLDASSSLMTKLSNSTSNLSFSAPGAEIAGSPAKGNAASGGAFARKWNNDAVSLRTNQPDNLGFFSALPSLTDVEGRH
ncbi:MAG: hypothetical protein ASARMPREDX12_008143 [Alectoria sarmentosa]|nr:MAG: hypothetical protein ASARMPREDX12_008143 [Alectoria sarmentosa]